MFADVLGRPVGRLDGFFSVGGHSLLAIKAVARLGEGVPLRWLFEEPTVAGLTRLLETHSAGPASRIVASDPGTPAPLSMNQEHMWFMEQLRPGDPLYTITQEFELGGPVDVLALRAALAEVVAVHDVLPRPAGSRWSTGCRCRCRSRSPRRTCGMRAARSTWPPGRW